MTELRDQARNKWHSILAALGIADSYLRNKGGPCPICRQGRDRFRFDDKDGLGTWYCNVCGHGDGAKLLKEVHGWSFAETAERVRGVLGEATERKPRPKMSVRQARQDMADLWQNAVPIGDDEAAAYLISRGLLGPYPDELRFCGSARVVDHPTKSRLAALLARVTGPDGTGVNVHRTYLESARKADMPEPRKLMPMGGDEKLPDGSAIRLSAFDGRLGAAEGIETALAVTRDFGMPCWSLINTTMMGKFRVPASVCEFHIFGDNDTKLGGQAAAYALGHRTITRANAPKVLVHIPDEPGTDWADRAPKEIAA